MVLVQGSHYKSDTIPVILNVIANIMALSCLSGPEPGPGADILKPSNYENIIRQLFMIRGARGPQMQCAP